jgi:hypothetical protein
MRVKNGKSALLSSGISRDLTCRLLGHAKIESAVRYLGIEVNDALAIAKQVDVYSSGAERNSSAPSRNIGAVPRTHISLPDQAQPVVSTCRTLAGIVVLSISGLRRPASLIPDQSHETFVLMVLVVAVEERRAGVIGDKINFRCGEARHVQRVLHHP